MGDDANGANTMSISFGHAIDAAGHVRWRLQRGVRRSPLRRLDRWLLTDTGGHADVTSPDNVLVSGRLASGGVVSAHVASQPAHGSGQRLEVYGREGTLVGGQRREPACSAHARAIPHWRSCRYLSALTWVPADRARRGPAFNVAQMYRRFGESIRDGGDAQPDFDARGEAPCAD